MHLEILVLGFLVLPWAIVVHKLLILLYLVCHVVISTGLVFLGYLRRLLVTGLIDLFTVFLCRFLSHC